VAYCPSDELGSRRTRHALTRSGVPAPDTCSHSAEIAVSSYWAAIVLGRILLGALAQRIGIWPVLDTTSRTPPVKLPIHSHGERCSVKWARGKITQEE
jgi:hypothetical protein